MTHQDYDRYVTAAEIISHLGISEPTFFRWVKAGILPAGTRIGVRAVRWKMSQIDAAIAALNKGDAA